MIGLLRGSLKNPYAVTVAVLSIIVFGLLSLRSIPIDILPVFKAPAVQVLTFYNGMPADNVETSISNRMERGTGQAAGTIRQESRSIFGASIVRNYYAGGTDPNGALTQVNSLASLELPTLPPGTLPPVILPYDPTGTSPACIVAVDSPTQPESILFDAAHYEVRNMIMSARGAVAPVVYGGKVRAVMAYLDPGKLQARDLSPLDVMAALDNSNIFLPAGDAKIGNTDYAVGSNSMYSLVDRMGDIPLRTELGNATFLKDVATPRDASFIQTNIVRVNGRREVYVPVYRQGGASTLDVVDNLKRNLPDMQSRLTRPNIDLKLVMDQSVYVRHAIQSLIEEGVLGAILCSLVILVFLGEWRMTMIAIITIPVSVMAAVVGLYYSGNTINVMSLAGLSLAIGPLVDSAIICLENTHRHLGLGAAPIRAAYLGASEVALPELAASCCTLLVLMPLAFMPGLGEFLFKPMAFAVAFAMAAAYLLSRSFVPSRCAAWLKGHSGAEGHSGAAEHGAIGKPVGSNRSSRLFDRWEGLLNRSIDAYGRALAAVMRRRGLTVATAVIVFIAAVAVLGPRLRREFFPEVDAGTFEIYVRGPTGTRIEATERSIAKVEQFVRGQLKDDCQLIISELGVTSDWSAAYTPNSGPMDAVVKVQLQHDRKRSAQEYVALLRKGFHDAREFDGLEFAFDAGGMIRGAMNEGKSTPINIRIRSKQLPLAHRIAKAIQAEVVKIDGVVDCRVLQRLNYPKYVIEVDRKKAAEQGLDQASVMKNVVTALNSSIQFNKKNFWIDPVSRNQYFVGVQYPEGEIQSPESLLDVPVTSPVQNHPIPLRNMASLRKAFDSAEVTHTNLQPTIDLTMGVAGRNLGHVADDIAKVLDRYGKPIEPAVWAPFNPDSPSKETLTGSKIDLSGEYTRMEDTFRNLGAGLVLASVLVYFLLVALFRSYVMPLIILIAVPLGLVGVVVMLYLTGTAVNVQSLLGVIFMVGIVVSNTVLLVDFAQKLRLDERLTPTEAIRRAAAVRVRPVVMTALATFFALLPMALALARGGEANAPLGRAVVGGLLAGLATTLFVVPALYSLLVRESSDAHGPSSGELDRLLGTLPED